MGIRVAVLAVLWVGVPACAGGRDESLTRVRDAAVLRVAFAHEPPWAYRDSTGAVTGESIAVARAVAARLGIPRLEFIQTEFALLVPMLRSGEADVIASGLFVTPERRRFVAFARPHLRVREALVLAPGDPMGVRDFPGLVAREDAIVAVIAGAVEGDLLRSAGVPARRLLLVPDVPTAVAAVRFGRAAALLVSHPTARRLTNGTNLTLVPLDDLPASEVALAFRREDRDLCTAVDAALGDLIGTPGYLQAIADFGFTAEDLPVRARRGP